MSLDCSAVGLNAKLKITTTSREKKSMELMASLERHSIRRSFNKVARITFMLILRLRHRRQRMPKRASHSRETRFFLRPYEQTHRPRVPPAQPDGSRRRLSSPGPGAGREPPPCNWQSGCRHSKTAHRAALTADRATRRGTATAAGACP